MFVGFETNGDGIYEIKMTLGHTHKDHWLSLLKFDRLKSNLKVEFGAAIAKNHTRRVPSLHQKTPCTCPAGISARDIRNHESAPGVNR